ncbi:MAG TPA: caspase family protein [Pyrinomonadaceae bacterium]|jgi:hypothetical protein|nr:caspase family protein [Pyrinomonadaceae bacterium]
MKDLSPRLRFLVVLTVVAATLSFIVATPNAQAQKAATPPAAQSKELTLTNDAPIRTLPDRSKRYAVVIGVDKYTADEQIPPLVGAGNDAKLLAEALVKYAGFPADQIVVLSSDQSPERQPMRSNIYKVLNGLKGQVKKDGMLLVAFSGHGIEQNGRAFLLPQDALSNRDMIEDYGIPVDSLKERIRRTDAGQVMLFLDACRNDPEAGKGDADNPLTQPFMKEFDLSNQGIEAFVTIYAASVGQRAWEDKTKKQGYFTMVLVEGLKGEAADPETGRVTLQNLIRYIGEQVPRRVKRANIDKEQKPYTEMGGDYKANDLLLAITQPKNPVKVAPVAAAPVAPVIVLPTTGAVAVVSEPNALITLTPVNAAKGQPSKTLTFGPDQRYAPVENLPLGRYLVTATREGYTTAKAEVEVVAGKSAEANLHLKAISYQANIKTNVLAGRVEFGLKNEATNQIVPLKNGAAALQNLAGGEYVVKIIPEDVGYVAKTANITVAGNADFDIRLERPLAVQPVEAEFTAAHWEVPAAWRLATGLQVTGAGLGMLREDVSQRFANLQIITNIELTTGSGISFVIRAVDKQNYYIVRLSGPKGGNSQNMLRFFVVKDGKQQQIGSSYALKGFNLNEQFDFTITAKDNQFDFIITDSNGRPESAGRFFDVKNTFTSGAVGVAANPDEQAKIGRFYVCPNQCQ